MNITGINHLDEKNNFDDLPCGPFVSTQYSGMFYVKFPDSSYCAVSDDLPPELRKDGGRKIGGGLLIPVKLVEVSVSEIPKNK